MCPSETVQCEDYECTDEGEEQVQQFAVVVKPDPEDEGFVATIPGVPGVVGHGHTEEEVLAAGGESGTGILTRSP